MCFIILHLFSNSILFICGSKHKKAIAENNPCPKTKPENRKISTLQFATKPETSEMEKQSYDHKIQKLKLGSQGLEVSKLGFGCFGLSGILNSPVTEEAGIAIINDAFCKGITFFDTADCYGPHTNEILIGKALKELPREKIQIVTKFGIVKYNSDMVEINGRPEYVRASCEASLVRLGVDYIDLYYQHRVDTSVPIEETMGELKKLVEEGKVKFIGLSEASPDTIQMGTVHPVTAVQMEWSLWVRDIEEEIVPLCRELGIGLDAYSPLGQGFFAGKASQENLPENSLLAFHPKFIGENLEKNKVLYSSLKRLSVKLHCSTSQLALAWLLNQGNYVVPIPGTTKIKNLEENIGALEVQLTEKDLKEISDSLPISEVGGPRIVGPFASLMWQSANTPAMIEKEIRNN